MELNKQDETLIKMIKEHDRFYDYSDDMTAYSRGKAEKTKILIYLSAKYGMDIKEALKIYTELTK
jgi:hypothetical protein